MTDTYSVDTIDSLGGQDAWYTDTYARRLLFGDTAQLTSGQLRWLHAVAALAPYVGEVGAVYIVKQVSPTCEKPEMLSVLNREYLIINRESAFSLKTGAKVELAVLPEAAESHAFRCRAHEEAFSRLYQRQLSRIAAAADVAT